MDTTRSGPSVRVSGLLVEQGRLLLVRQARAERTYWLLPGGGVHRGETLAEALAREIAEECGLTVRAVGPPFALIETISPDSGRHRHLLQLVMGVEVATAGNLAHPRDPAILEVVWFSAELLADIDLHPPVADLLPAWVAHFGDHPVSAPPPFVATGRRWIE